MVANRKKTFIGVGDGLYIYSGSHVFNGNENSSIGYDPRFISVVCSTCYITLITQILETSFVTLKIITREELHKSNQLLAAQSLIFHDETLLDM